MGEPEEGRRRIPGAFDGLPGDLQEQPMLRIHVFRLGPRHTKEFSIERVGAIQQRSIPCVHFSCRTGIGIVKRVNVPTVGANRTRAVPSGIEHAPEQLRIVAARKAAPQADDGYSFVPFRLSVAQLRLKLGGKQNQLRLRERTDALDEFIVHGCASRSSVKSATPRIFSISPSDSCSMSESCGNSRRSVSRSVGAAVPSISARTKLVRVSMVG